MPQPETTPRRVATDFAHLRQVAEVWPQAVRRLPGRLPGGGEYSIAAALGSDRYLVRDTGQVGVYDHRTGTVRQLARATPDMSIEAVAIAGDTVTWAVVSPGGQRFDIWLGRLGSGVAVRLAVVDGRFTPATDRVLAIGAQVYWTNAASRPGIFRVPLIGGRVTKLPDSDGELLGPAPWATRAADGTARNLVTGAARPAAGGCGSAWCVVQGADEQWSARPDATGERFPCGCYGNLRPVGLDGRIIAGDLWPTAAKAPFVGWRGVVWDARTNKAAEAGGPVGEWEFFTPHGNDWGDGTVVALDPRDDVHVILDLTAL